MKKGWTYKKLGEVSSFQNGFAFKSNLFRKEGCPIIRISNIQNEEVQTDDIVYFYKEDYPVNFDNFKIFPNDILIAMSGGTTGKLGINTTNTIFYQNQRVGVIREDKKTLNHRFLFYFLHTKSEESLKIAAGAAQPNLSTAQIKDFIIPLPPLSEQQSIVDYLDSAFAKIDAMKANAAKALHEAKALFQAELSEAMKPKEGWTYKKLGEIATFARGLTYSKKDEVERSNNIVLRSNNIDLLAGKLEFSELKYLKADFVIPEDKRIRKGSLIICMSNGSKAHLGKVAYVDKDYGYAFGGFMGQITPNNDVDGLYLHYALSSPLYKDYIKSLSEGANINNLKYKDLAEFVIKYPPLFEQQRIVSRLDALSAHIRKLEAIAEKTKVECDALKQAMLREVFE